MKAKDIIFLVGLCCIAVASKLKSRVDSAVAWQLGDIMETIGPILVGAKAMPEKKEEQKPNVTD